MSILIIQCYCGFCIGVVRVDFRLPSSRVNGILVYRRVVAPCWCGEPNTCWVHRKKNTKHRLVKPVFLQERWFVGDLAALSPFA